MTDGASDALPLARRRWAIAIVALLTIATGLHTRAANTAWVVS